MDGRYRRNNNNNNYTKEDQDFDEEQIWGVMEDNNNKNIKNSSSPRNSNLNNGKNKSSLPLEIPNWSKIYGKTVSYKKNNNVTSSSSSFGNYNTTNNEDEDEDEDDMVPPHEYLAKKLARSQISSFSVYEGIGRTLRGRDLSKVRNTILSKTGFLE